VIEKMNEIQMIKREKTLLMGDARKDSDLKSPLSRSNKLKQVKF
jgi:hypothetical protein